MSQNQKIDGCLFSSAFSVKQNSTDWYVDSGASAHMTMHKAWLQGYKRDAASLEITVANNEKLKSEGRGDVLINLNNKKKTISNVVYVPNINLNLLSVSEMVKKGHVVNFSEEGCKIYHKSDCSVRGVAIARADEIGGVYKLRCSQVSSKSNLLESAQVNSVTNNNSQGLWHRRLGHLNVVSMNLLKNGMATGVNFKGEVKPCVACIEGKQTRLPFNKQSTTRAKNVLEVVHTDLCGPMSVASYGGSRYLLTFIDDFTRKTFGYYLESKSEVLNNFKEWKILVENQTGRKIKCIRSDNGTEYINKNFKRFLQENGIVHQTTVPYSPEQNGVAERANRTIIEKARSLLLDAKLDRRYWAEAVNTVIYLKNRSPTKALRRVTPEEAWSGKKVDLSHLRVFGSVAYAHIPKQNRRKLDSKSRRLMLIGYSTESKGYKLVDPQNPRKITISRDVTFIEEPNQVEKSSSKQYQTCELPLEEESEEVEGSNAEELEETQEHQSEASLSEDEQQQPERRYPMRERRQKEFPGFELYSALCDEDIPGTVKDALSGEDRELWNDAMKKEYQSFHENNTWTLVELPKNAKAVQCRWVFTIKRDLEGKIKQHKARLVAKGFTQKFGVDYNETFSPVVKYSTIRFLLATAAELDLKIDQMDVTTAFLNGELNEVVYMKQPEGFVVEGREDHVCLLKKAVYGLKQAPRQWNMKMNAALLKIGFKRSSSEPCVYFRINNKSIIIIALYVDDVLLFYNNEDEKVKIKTKLMKEFKMKDLGPAKQILGMRLRNTKDSISLDQKGYIEKVLAKFEMSDCKPCITPMDPGMNFEKGRELDPAEQHQYPYQALIGCLMYMAVTCRPDIAHAASVLSQFNSCFTQQHWKAAKRVLRYLKGTVDMCLTYKKAGSKLEGFVDADWGGDKTDRRSYSGYVFKLATSAVSWESKKQRTVALSTAEAEYMALSEGAKEAIFLRSLSKEIFGEKEFAITIHTDNQAAQKLAENQVCSKRTKHIDIRYHFLRDAVDRGDLNLEYIPSQDMIADIMTKGLNGPRHKRLIGLLGLVPSL